MFRFASRKSSVSAQRRGREEISAPIPILRQSTVLEIPESVRTNTPTDSSKSRGTEKLLPTSTAVTTKDGKSTSRADLCPTSDRILSREKLMPLLMLAEPTEVKAGPSRVAEVPMPKTDKADVLKSDAGVVEAQPESSPDQTSALHSTPGGPTNRNTFGYDSMSFAHGVTGNIRGEGSSRRYGAARSEQSGSPSQLDQVPE
ncbi:MAG: hypothetical protein M1825_000480 [Sarcosagium campestre]|nr:MAG: hypothetical protein M1825_000480 [Sarcosagium campestre]